ncbi:MAG: glycerophosphodiester phosphodiesterase [Clostridiales bacterium]|jgi:glycerophosphoryl diester phosphodiesterase|nr:glycerophosphodiester phosphodiesterase [Clostridiales bacterium]
MSNNMAKSLFFAAAGGTLAAAASAYILAPGKAEGSMRAPFYGRNLAHRGLHTADKSIPENSLPAFEEAARIGYGIELDVRITKDGELVVFHDEDLTRACAATGCVGDTTWEDLSRLRLFGTEHGIPLLSEALEVIGGRGPLIVELKQGNKNRELCEKTYSLLKGYAGDFCVESFDPRIVGWFRRNAPEVLRGQLAYHPADMAKDTRRANAFLVGNLLTNFIARPHFIAYGIGCKPLTVRLCERLGAMRVAWTSRGPDSEENNDAVIFEHYRPRPRYK